MRFTSDKELGFLQRGFFRREELERLNVIPEDEMIEGKRLAVIECTEEIPCNPCGFICPVDAILKESLCTPPLIDWNKCVGCTKCVCICPGLAIFLLMIDSNKGYVTLPYEFLPKPKLGDVVELFDRSGKVIERGKIVNPTYQARGKAHPLWCVTVEFRDTEIINEVRAIKILK